MPPKPMELMKGSGVEFYNIDFSLQNQLRLAGASVPQSLQDQVSVPGNHLFKCLKITWVPPVTQVGTLRTLGGVRPRIW
jgi:hypothetical protein